MTEQSITINAIVDAIAETVILKMSLRKANEELTHKNTSYLLDLISGVEKRIEVIEANAEISNNVVLHSMADKIAILSDQIDIVDGKIDDLSDGIETAVCDILRKTINRCISDI